MLQNWRSSLWAVDTARAAIKRVLLDYPLEKPVSADHALREAIQDATYSAERDALAFLIETPAPDASALTMKLKPLATDDIEPTPERLAFLWGDARRPFPTNSHGRH